MKIWTFLTILFCFATFSESCTKDNIVFSEEDIIGAWRSEKITFNGIHGDDLSPGLETSTHLNLEAEKSYYLNYVSGSWAVQGDQLVLNPNPELSILSRTYKILSLSGK